MLCYRQPIVITQPLNADDVLHGANSDMQFARLMISDYEAMKVQFGMDRMLRKVQHPGRHISGSKRHAMLLYGADAESLQECKQILSCLTEVLRRQELDTNIPVLEGTDVEAGCCHRRTIILTQWTHLKENAATPRDINIAGSRVDDCHGI